MLSILLKRRREIDIDIARSGDFQSSLQTEPRATEKAAPKLFRCVGLVRSVSAALS
jgi:hypothetical protein